MIEGICPAPTALREALDLSGEILRNIELSEIPLTRVALKASRLARLVNELEFQKIMAYEASGYPVSLHGIAPEIWELAKVADRLYEGRDPGTHKDTTYAHTESIEQLETEQEAARGGLEVAGDPDISISSANPNQAILTPIGNVLERRELRKHMTDISRLLSHRRSFIYQYVLRKHYELKFSGIASDVFSRIRALVDGAIGSVVPDAVQKFTAVHENLLSENPEDWSNAVHSCRRILKSLADAVFPPQSVDRIIKSGDKDKSIRLGDEHYINRLVCFVEDCSTSERFTHLVGSHLRFLGDRLDAISLATQKGSHTTIVSREEADRYVVYTYLVVGDILSLKGGQRGPSEEIKELSGTPGVGDA